MAAHKEVMRLTLEGRGMAWGLLTPPDCAEGKAWAEADERLEEEFELKLFASSWQGEGQKGEESHK